MKKLLVLILFSSFVYSQDYAKGKELFKTHCAACHNMERKMVGPALKDIVERQGKDWTKKWIYNNTLLEIQVMSMLFKYGKNTIKQPCLVISFLRMKN